MSPPRCQPSISWWWFLWKICLYSRPWVSANFAVQLPDVSGTGFPSSGLRMDSPCSFNFFFLSPMVRRSRSSFSSCPFSSSYCLSPRGTPLIVLRARDSSCVNFLLGPVVWARARFSFSSGCPVIVSHTRSQFLAALVWLSRGACWPVAAMLSARDAGVWPEPGPGVSVAPEIPVG